MHSNITVEVWSIEPPFPTDQYQLRPDLGHHEHPHLPLCLVTFREVGSESERGVESDGSLKCLWFQTILDLTMKFKNSASEIMLIPLEAFGKAQLQSQTK